MKVKVSYTVDINDVPEIVEEILSSVRKDLSACVSKIKFTPSNFTKMLEVNKDVDEKLDLVRSQLQDITNITAGWLNTNQESEDVTATSTDQESEEKFVEEKD